MKTILKVAVLSLALSAHAVENPPPRLGPGDSLPAVLGIDISGDKTESAAYAGKVMVVTFWASWCAPCRKELPMLDGIQKVAGKDKLQVVAVNIEERDVFRKVAKVLAPLSVKITHDYGREASQAFGVKGIPHCAIVGRDGKILAVHRGYSEDSLDSIIAEINEALAK